MLALVLAVTLVIVPTFAPYNQVLLLPAVFLIAVSWRDLWKRKPAYSRRLRSGIAGCGLALDGILRTHAGFAFFASGCGSTSLGRTSLYQSWHSAGGFGIVKCVRQRSLAGLFGSRRAKTVETWSGL